MRNDTLHEEFGMATTANRAAAKFWPGRAGSSDERASDSTEAAPLAEELAGRVRGEVRFDPGSRALYATAASNYRQVPIGVVVPRDVDDVIATIATCHARGVPILARGGGTSLAGQTSNVA